MTGMDVKYDVFPEDVYFDKVTAALSSKSTQYDAFMTGAYQTWQYGPAGWLVDMNEYIKDPAKTNPQYNWDDVLPNLRASTAWSGEPGAELGVPGAKQWASRGASSSTRSPTTAPISTRSACSRPRTCPASSRRRRRSPDASGPLRHRRARLAQLGDDPSGLPLGVSNYGARDFNIRAASSRPP